MSNLSVREAATMTGTNSKTVRKWAQNASTNGLPCTREIGESGRVEYSIDPVEFPIWLANRREEQPVHHT